MEITWEIFFEIEDRRLSLLPEEFIYSSEDRTKSEDVWQGNLHQTYGFPPKTVRNEYINWRDRSVLLKIAT